MQGIKIEVGSVGCVGCDVQKCSAARVTSSGLYYSETVLVGCPRLELGEVFVAPDTLALMQLVLVNVQVWVNGHLVIT